MKNVPLPPAIGDKFRDRFGTLFHTRAIIDYRKGTEKTREYVVILRQWRRNSWYYIAVPCWDIELDLYVPEKQWANPAYRENNPNWKNK